MDGVGPCLYRIRLINVFVESWNWMSAKVCVSFHIYLIKIHCGPTTLVPRSEGKSLQNSTINKRSVWNERNRIFPCSNPCSMCFENMLKPNAFKLCWDFDHTCIYASHQ